jgi:hypothetical protein
MPEVTETQLYHAWRLLEAVGRSRADNMAQSQAAVEPAMQILAANLDELGFTIVGGALVPKPPAEEPEEGGEELEKPPPGSEEPPLGEGETPEHLPAVPATAQHSAGKSRWRSR